MPYCPNCGAQNKDTAKFCESCGAALVSVAPATPESVPPVQSATQTGTKPPSNVNALITVAACIYAFSMPLAMITLGPMGFFTALIALAVILGLAYEPLRKGNIASAKTGLLIGAGLAGFYTLLDFATNQPVAAFINLIACVALVIAYMQLK